MSRYCLLGLLLLWAIAGRAQVLLFENFNTSLPPTWTIVNGGSNPATWTRTTNGLSGQTLNGTQFMICNSDAAGNIPPVLLHEELVSPTVNAAGQPLLYLEFDHYLRHNGLTDSAHVDVWDGSTWHRIVSYTSTLGGFNLPAHQQYNISAYANANLKVRFVYDDNFTWAWYWALDNVQIIAPSPFDVRVSAFGSPLHNGRRYSATALTANETVQVAILNLGSVAASNIPVYMQVDGGPILGPTSLNGPLAPSQIQNLTLANTANLAAVGTHTLRVWTQLVGDANPANDTLSITLRQYANNPFPFPHCVSFEGLPDTALQSYSVGIANLEEADFSTSIVGAGRLRTHAGVGYAYAGNRALTLDRNPSNSPDAINFVTFTWNLAQFQAASDVLLADLWLMEHGDEVQLSDSIWIRGCDTCAWIDVLAWNNMTGGNNAVYFNTPTLNLSNLLISRGQDYSASFQLRIGQEDNFASTSLAGSDGLTIDNVCLRRLLPINAGVTAIPSPLSQGGCGDSLTPVTVTVTNFGTVSLSNVPLRVDVAGATTATLNGSLPGPLAPGASATAPVGTINAAAGGNFTFAAYTLVAADSARADDTLWTQIALAPQLPMPTVMGDTVCAGSSGLVRVLSANPNLQYAWYDQPSGGSLLGLGDSLAVGPFTVPGNYYVEARSRSYAHLGPANNQIGAGSDFSSLADGLRFDALVDFVFDSVLVYPSDTGIVRLVLSNASGIKLDSVAVAVAPGFASQPVRIAVGMSVPAGSGYFLRASGSTVPGLFRNSSGATYPYTLPGVAAITGASNALPGYYYFFYDWVISYFNCPGPRATALVDTTSASPIASFMSQANGLLVQFTNASAHANQYAWDFGDGTSSTQSSPSHNYLVDGNYNACLIAYGPCGNDTTCSTITVACHTLLPGFTLTATNLSVQVNDTTPDVVGQAWNFGDGQSGTGANAQHSYTADGQYTICLQNWNVCSDTAQYCDSILVCAPLTAAINFTPSGLQFSFSNSGNGTPTDWEWEFGDGNTSNLAAPSHTYGAAGSYLVTLIVHNLCGESDTTTTNITVVGLADGIAGGLRLFPNPMSGKATLELPGSWAGNYTLRVHDALGRSLQTRILQLSGDRNMQQVQIYLEDVTKGNYWLVVHGEGQHIAIPFLYR